MEETTNGHSKKNEDKGKIPFAQYGFRSAQNSQSNPEAVDGYLNNVFDQFLEEQKLDERGLKDRISKLKAESQQDKVRRNDANAELSSNRRYKEDKDKEIEELELEKIDIKNGDWEIGDTSSFVIGAFITFLLTLYLFVFYSSSGYSAFYGIKNGSLGWLNPDVFSDAKNKGGGVLSLIILFPVIFLGLGFLIHNSIETNKKLVAQGKRKTYTAILALLFITFIADIFIGYKIAEGIYENKINAGLVLKPWNLKMIFVDINFYLVLILGFVVYVIWGFLLNYVLSHPYLKTENEKVKLLIENLNIKISDKRREQTEIISKGHKLDSEISNLEFKIQEKEKDIIGYENGVIPINVSSLKGSIGEFMGGWQNYTNGNFANEKALQLNTEVLKCQSIWLINKIQNLNTDF